jgi:biopolymer transport protein ExbD
MPVKPMMDEPPSLNLTPMIDVVFLLIIFFMLGTKFTEIERKLQLRIPEVAEADMLLPPPDPKVVTVYRDGTVTLDRRPVDLEELRRALESARREFPGLSVLVRGDMETRFQRIAEVLSTCRQAQVNIVSVAVRPTEGEGLAR